MYIRFHSVDIHTHRIQKYDIKSWPSIREDTVTNTCTNRHWYRISV